jgi:hypothetical protein
MLLERLSATTCRGLVFPIAREATAAAMRRRKA